MLKTEADYNNPNPGTLAFALMEIERLKRRIVELEFIINKPLETEDLTEKA